MVSRRVAIALALVLALAGLAAVVGAATDDRPTLTVENRADAPRHVTAFTVEDRRAAMLTNVEVTTEDGERRLATVSQLVWPSGFRNLTVVDDVETQHLTVEPGANATARVEGWTRGDVTVYLVEDPGDDWRHVHTDVVTCPQRDQEHEYRFRGDGVSSTKVCASGFGPLLP